MRQFGLIGHPLSHSFSKKYFTEKFKREGLTDCRYENYPIAAIDALPALWQSHPQLEGINVTIPYKEQVIPYLSEQSEVVTRIQACNCITIRQGRLKGYNTDVTGFELSLIPLLQSHHRQALVLGTGGAARAVEYVLDKLGIPFLYVSRKPVATALSYEDLTPAVLASHSLIINTTPIGMYPHTMACPPIPYEALTPQHYLFDLVYNPAKTVFLQQGEARGATVKNGEDMLWIQAEESWKIWNGLKG